MNFTKIWAGIKLAVALLILIYVLVFVAQNSSNPVKFWYWYAKNADTSVLLLALWAFLGGVVFTLVIRTLIRTVRQLNEMRHRANVAKLADQQSKAGMLQTKPDSAARM